MGETLRAGFFKDGFARSVAGELREAPVLNGPTPGGFISCGGGRACLKLMLREKRVLGG